MTNLSSDWSYPSAAVRRAKLYYLRGRSGKRARIAERARTAGPSGEAPATTNETEAAD